MRQILNNGASTLAWKIELPVFEKVLVSYCIGKLFCLPITMNVVGYHERLVYLLLAVHWSQSSVMLQDVCLLIVFHHLIAAFFSKKRPSSFQNIGVLWSFILYRSILFWKMMAGSRSFCLFLKNYHWIVLDLSVSSLISASFFMVITFALLTYQHTPFAVLHLIYQAVLHSLLYHFDSRSFHSMISVLHFICIYFILYFKLY